MKYKNSLIIFIPSIERGGVEKNLYYIANFLSKKKINLALAGGVFANVKLNQKIKDLKNIKDIFVFPNMGDGGLAVGCAQLCYYNKTKKIPKKINNVYFGYSFSDKETINTIKKNKLNFISNGDDYQILFTASKKMRHLIKKISKSTSTKVSIVGIVKNKSISKNRKSTEEKFKFPKKLGYIHNF